MLYRNRTEVRFSHGYPTHDAGDRQWHLECTSKMTKVYKCPSSLLPLLSVGVDSCLVKPKFKVKPTGIL